MESLADILNYYGKHGIPQLKEQAGDGADEGKLVWVYFRRQFASAINPLTPKLNPSAQRCLKRFFLLGIFLLEPCISLIYG
jgi:hypothetical protein